MFTGMFRNRSFDEAVTLAKKIGYEAVEIRVKEPHMTLETPDSEFERMSDLVSNLGLEVASLYSFIGGFSNSSDKESEENFNKFKRYIEIALIFKTRRIKVNCGGPHAFLSQNYHYEKAAYWLRRCADYADTYNVKILLEIHNGSLIERLDSASKLIDMVERYNIGLIHDAGNLYITGEEFGEKSVKYLGNKIMHVHIKDVERVNNKDLPDTFYNLTKNGRELFRLTKLGEGQTNHQPLINALVNSGYDGYLSTEANLTMDDLEMTTHEFNELNRMINLQEKTINI